MLCLTENYLNSTSKNVLNITDSIHSAFVSAFNDAEKALTLQKIEMPPRVTIAICHECNSTHTSDESLCNNMKIYEDNVRECYEKGKICCSKDAQDIFTYNPCFPHNTTCEREEVENHDIVLDSIKVPYFIYGLIGIIGNMVVIYEKLKNMYVQPKQQKEIKIFLVLVLNLSMADLLMGVYVFALSTNIIAKENSADHFIEYTFCNILGVMNFASSQISVTILVLISTFRWYSVAFPYKQVSSKLAYYLVTVAWIFWTIMAIFPIAPNRIFQNFFKYGVRLDQNKEHDLHVPEPVLLLKNLLKSSSNSSGQYENILNKEFTPNEVIRMLQTLGIVDPVEHTAEPLGYYNLQPVCSVNLILSDHFSPSSYFTLFVLIFNTSCFFVISMCYSVILKAMIQSGNVMSCTCFGLLKSNRVTDSGANKQDQRRYFENKSMFRRVVVVVATDFLCWVPICLISLIFFLQSAGYEENNCTSREHTCTNLSLYHGIQIAVFYVIPVNSSINPYVYSFHFWQNIIIRLKKSVFKLFKCNYSNSSSLASDTAVDGRTERRHTRATSTELVSLSVITQNET